MPASNFLLKIRISIPEHRKLVLALSAFPGKYNEGSADQLVALEKAASCGLCSGRSPFKPGAV
jgi:hypothetical protein